MGGTYADAANRQAAVVGVDGPRAAKTRPAMAALGRSIACPDLFVAPPSVTGAADDLGVLCRTNSFVPATLILMADGTTQPIADFRVGDMVMATDPESGERGPRRVTDTITGDGMKDLVDVEIDGNVITATDRHPFWVDDEGRWVDAEDLNAGDVLSLADGETVTVDAVAERTEVRRVHNLTVDGIHTYFVLAGGDPVLVHNCTGTPRPPRRPQNPSDPPSWVRQGGHYAEATNANPAAAAVGFSTSSTALADGVRAQGPSSRRLRSGSPDTSSGGDGMQDLFAEALRLQNLEDDPSLSGSNPALTRLTAHADFETLLERARYLRAGSSKERQLHARLLAGANMPAGRRLAEVLQTLAEESDPQVIRWLVFGLRNAASASALGLLRELAQHPSSEVRFPVPDALSACADRFGEIGDVLFQLSRDADADVRWSAVFELGAWWGVTQDAQIETRLAEVGTEDPSEEVREAAKEGLSRSGSN